MKGMKQARGPLTPEIKRFLEPGRSRIAAQQLSSCHKMNILNCTANDMDTVWTTMRKKEGWEAHECSKKTGLKAELYHKHHTEKIQMKKTIKMHKKRNTKQKDGEKTPQGASPAYLLDREGQRRAKPGPALT